MKAFWLSILVILSAGSGFALDLAPAVMVETSTNNYNVLTGKTAQADFDFIDDWLVAESNRLTSVSNLAQAAYALASTNVGTGSTRVYSYENTGTLSVAAATAGEAWFYASTQSIGRLHSGMAVTGSTFSAGTTITSVEYDTRKVNISLVCAGSGAAAASFWGGGSYTHIVPTNWTRCKIVVTGGGASGGADANAGDGAGGGGGGGTSIGWWRLAAGDSYAITVGAGGTSVTNDANGNAGGTSSFGSLQTATGGAAGIGAGGGGPSLGGIGTGGQLNLSGGCGDFAQDWSGGSASPQDGGNGGSSYWGGGGKGSSGGDANVNGMGKSPGAGGGGGDGDGISGRGASGIVVVEYF